MIFRKPYAFLIKNFKKIHIVMLALTIFIYFKLNDILDFIRDYINFGTYNKVLEPFSKEVGILFYLAIILILVISISSTFIQKKETMENIFSLCI